MATKKLTKQDEITKQNLMRALRSGACKGTGITAKKIKKLFDTPVSPLYTVEFKDEGKSDGQRIGPVNIDSSLRARWQEVGYTPGEWYTKTQARKMAKTLGVEFAAY